MIFDFVDSLNWLAILVASVAWFIYNAVYYSVPPISKAWQAAAKVTAQPGPPLPAIMVASFIVYLVTSTFIGLLVAATGAVDLADGAVLGASLGVAFGAAGALINQMYEQKGGSYWLINGISAVVSWAIVGGILAAWDK
ncbi:MAG: DUF1761 domain-containing protein [Actinomycetota bacterium]